MAKDLEDKLETLMDEIENVLDQRQQRIEEIKDEI